MEQWRFRLGPITPILHDSIPPVFPAFYKRANFISGTDVLLRAQFRP